MYDCCLLCVYRTIDSLAVGYGKGKLKCFLGDLKGIIDLVRFDLSSHSSLIIFLLLKKKKKKRYARTCKNTIYIWWLASFKVISRSHMWYSYPSRVGKSLVLINANLIEYKQFFRVTLELYQNRVKGVLCYCMVGAKSKYPVYKGKKNDIYETY